MYSFNYCHATKLFCDPIFAYYNIQQHCSCVDARNMQILRTFHVHQICSDISNELFIEV